jgi:hypothetical protein
MRKKNMRFVWTGLLMVVLAGVFFVGMMQVAAKSNDPVGLMRTVGQVSGAFGAIGLVLAGLGMIGKKFPGS